MTDDLVKRLREKADRKTPNLHMEIKRIETEAADRIEELEKQFEELLVQNNRLEDFVTKDCVLRTEARLQIEKLKKEIMDVLEGKDD